MYCGNRYHDLGVGLMGEELDWAAGAGRRRRRAGPCGQPGPGWLARPCRRGPAVRCLPFDTGVGEPGPEDRPTAAAARWFNAPLGGLPAAAARRHGRTRVLADAGLVGVGTRSFLLDVGPPLDADQAAYVRGHFPDLLESLDGTPRQATAGRWPGSSIPATRPTSAGVTTCSPSASPSIHVGTAPPPPSPEMPDPARSTASLHVPLSAPRRRHAPDHARHRPEPVT